MSMTQLEPQQGAICIDRKMIADLHSRALSSPLKRSRYNLHSGPDSLVHEMVIGLLGDTYIRPHRHSQKEESFHIIEGELSVLLFDQDGAVTRCIPMSCTRPGSHLIYRLSPAVWHTVIIHSPFAVIHEVTNGPFTPDSAEFAEWAPIPERSVEAQRYLRRLEELIRHQP